MNPIKHERFMQSIRNSSGLHESIDITPPKQYIKEGISIDELSNHELHVMGLVEYNEFGWGIKKY